MDRDIAGKVAEPGNFAAENKQNADDNQNNPQEYKALTEIGHRSPPLPAGHVEKQKNRSFSLDRHLVDHLVIVR